MTKRPDKLSQVRALESLPEHFNMSSTDPDTMTELRAMFIAECRNTQRRKFTEAY